MTLQTDRIAQPSPAPARRSRGIEVLGAAAGDALEVLSADALAFVETLAREFEPRRRELLAARRARQAELVAGRMPDFLPETRAIREAEWKVAPPPRDLVERRVEITGPVDRKMVINALNSGANVYMADFEDANSPTWENGVAGQVNLRDAVRGTISYASPDGGNVYRPNARTATLMVRPRGWHLTDRHVLVDGQRVSASLLDFGLFFFHNARALLDKGSGPYFYLPKLESHREAQLWNDVFVRAQEALGVPRGSVRATVLIETILAAFEMDEILHALREHSAGLNCGRWDYIFSAIKKFSHDRQFLMPDRALVTMSTPFMRNYSLLTIKTCHRRGAHAMGGMAAQIPIKNDPAAHEAAMAKVRADKWREVADGHDGTWVAHPGLVPVAEQVFRVMPQANQIDRPRHDVRVSAEDLLPRNVPGGVSEAGIRTNVSVGIQYLEAWLRGQGCVPINHLMEDAATAEISRAQLWQWVHHRAETTGGHTVTAELVDRITREELTALRDRLGAGRFDGGKFGEAARLFEQMTHSAEFPEFLTSIAYESLE